MLIIFISVEIRKILNLLGFIFGITEIRKGFNFEYNIFNKKIRWLRKRMTKKFKYH